MSKQAEATSWICAMCWHDEKGEDKPDHKCSKCGTVTDVFGDVVVVAPSVPGKEGKRVHDGARLVAYEDGTAALRLDGVKVELSAKGYTALVREVLKGLMP